MKYIKYIALTLLVLLVLSITKTYAYWSIPNGHNSSTITNVQTGNWSYNIYEPYDPNKDYNVGDIFTYDNKNWVVLETWFKWQVQYLFNPDGTINYHLMSPYNTGINEVTNEYRPYNTYYTNDIVVYEGNLYKALNGGANHSIPGTNEYHWQKLD